MVDYIEIIKCNCDYFENLLEEEGKLFETFETYLMNRIQTYDGMNPQDKEEMVQEFYNHIKKITFCRESFTSLRRLVDPCFEDPVKFSKKEKTYLYEYLKNLEEFTKKFITPTDEIILEFFNFTTPWSAHLERIEEVS